jgi:hypothetical protein
MKDSRLRLALYFLSLSLSLVFTSGAAAQSSGGVEAQGTVTLHTAQGDESGAISIEAADAAHCRVTITLGPAVLHRAYTAVLNGARVAMSGPAGVVVAAPLPVSPGLGCALLPAAIAGAKLADIGASLHNDAAGLATGLSWKPGGRAAEVAFRDYSATDGISYARTVTETVDGTPVLNVHLDAVAPKALTDSDFALPPPPPLPKLKSAGGAQ